MKLTTIIIDDFLDNPDKVRESVLSLDFYRKGDFPGLRSDRADLEYEKYIKDRIESVLNKNISEWKQDSFCFQLCLEGSETWIHHDDTEWAGVLYLTDGPVGAGTAIYRHVPTGIYEKSDKVDIKKSEDWEIITAIGSVFNRLVLYKADMYHKSLISGYGNSIQTGRLTQVFFFNTDAK